MKNTKLLFATIVLGLFLYGTYYLIYAPAKNYRLEKKAEKQKQDSISDAKERNFYDSLHTTTEEHERQYDKAMRMLFEAKEAENEGRENEVIYKVTGDEKYRVRGNECYSRHDKIAKEYLELIDSIKNNK